MADLSSVHRYAAGGLFALALGQAQIQQRSAFELAPDADSDDQQQAGTSFLDEPWTSWSSPENGLLRHIFRFITFELFLTVMRFHIILCNLYFVWRYRCTVFFTTVVFLEEVEMMHFIGVIGLILRLES